MKNVLPLAGAWAAACLGPCRAGTIYVDAGAPAGGTGISWTGAYRDLTAALAAAQSGDEVRVAQGTYKPGLPGSARTVTFLIPSGVAVRGGFAGLAGADPDLRNFSAFPTILSGDLSGNDGPSFSNYSDNAFHVVTITAGSSATYLDGLTIRAGYGGGVGGAGPGAGVFVSGGRPNIVDCTITANDNPGASGGGMALVSSFAAITRCTFSGNRCQSQGGGLSCSGSGPAVTDCVFDSNIGGIGAGVFNGNAGDPVFTRCTFRLNQGIIGIGSGAGYFESAATSTLNFCTFIRNSNGSGGGALYCSAAPLTQVNNCEFIGNRADFDGGGAVYTIGASGHTVFKGCLFAGNKTQANGNVVFVGSGTLCDLINCTMVNNGLGSGSAAISAGSVRLYGTIMWNNQDHAGTGQSSQFVGTVPTVDHCCIQGWTGSLGGAGNFGADPKFVSPLGADGIAGNEDDNPRLLPGFPCIDAGNNSWLSFFPTDLDGYPRYLDDPGTPDTGIGAAALADMGAFEFQGITCYANCDLSTTAPILNANDFQCFLNAFAAGNPYANCDSSTTSPVLNANDFQCFLNAFAGGCGS